MGQKTVLKKFLFFLRFSFLSIFFYRSKWHFFKEDFDLIGDKYKRKKEFYVKFKLENQLPKTEVGKERAINCSFC